jgi:ribosome-associated protein
MLVVNDRLQVPLKELRFHFVRSGGPGGQNVNKVNTKAVLRWAVTTTGSLPEGVRARFLARFKRRVGQDGDLVIASQRFRDRGRNVADCLAKLRVMLDEVAAPPRPRKRTRPTVASKVRRRRHKEHQSKKKQLRGRSVSDE